MPAKPTKYKINVWMAVNGPNSFVINHEVYLGKQPGRVLANGLGYSAVMELMSPFLNKNHVYFDNFFSSPAKPTKYEIKVWMAADASNGFVINHEIYLSW